MKLVKVTIENFDILENLMSLYLHDLSSYDRNRKPTEDGKYIYSQLDLYIKDNQLYPYLIYVDHQVIGFVLLDTGKYAPKGFDCVISELFIIQPYRRLGYGKEVVIELFNMFRGRYFVIELENNVDAIRFWKNILISQGVTFGERTLVIDEVDCVAQTFLII